MAKKNERKITASGSSSKATNKVLKPGSMASNSKMVTPKPKKATTSEKTRALMNRAYDLRTIKKINATPAEKAKQTRKSIDASRTAARAEAIANREDKKKAAKATAKKASYSPAPMSAFAKEKAAMRGAATQGKTGKLSPAQKKMFKELPREGSRKPKAGSSVVSKVVGRAKTVGREARDVVTAVGSAAQAVRKSPQENMPVAGAIKNVAKQVKEVGKAAVTGKKGTTPYKFTPNAASQKNRKERGSKGYVFYDIKNPKNR